MNPSKSYHPFGYLFRMVNEELTVIHSGEHLDVRVGVEGTQMLDLRFGDKSLFASVPVVDIGPVNGFQFMGINVLVTVSHRFPFAVRPHFPPSDNP